MKGTWEISMDSRSCSDQSGESFYTLFGTHATRYFQGRERVHREGPEFPHDFVGFRGTLVVRVWRGTVAADFIWGDYQLLTVSNRVLRLLESNHITGYSTYQVHVLGPKDKPVAGYHGLAISGRGGPSSPGCRTEYMVNGINMFRINGLKPSAWDGSDLFTLDDVPGAVLATEKVRGLFKKEKVTNCMFMPATEFRVG